MARTATTLAEAVSDLQTAKSALKTSIENKGVEIPSSATIDQYNTYVDQITGGGLTYVTVSTASTNLTAAWNNVYQWTVNPTAINITLPAAPADSTVEFVLKFTTSSTAPTVTGLSTVKWKNATAMTIEASTTYEISISYDMYAASYTAVYTYYR